jgi:isoquinoline 1-oxidoreductase beta subunit
MMLITAAAKRWNVPPTECVAENSIITHTRRNAGEVRRSCADAAKLRSPKTLPERYERMEASAGQPIKRLDIPDKVTGKTQFAIDTQLPGLRYAAIAQCPVFGGNSNMRTLTNREDAWVVKVVPMDDAVAVVAAGLVVRATSVKRAANRGTWRNAKVSSASIMEFLREGLNMKDAPVSRSEGDVEKAFFRSKSRRG